MSGVKPSPEERKLRAEKKREYRERLKAYPQAKDKRTTVHNGNGTGRPTLKTPELCKEICDCMAEGETLTDICRDATMPDWSTVHRWATRDDAFRNDLARARELQAEVWADELVDISDAELPTREAIRRARLRMQSRQWLAGKYNSRFADKPNQTQVNVGLGVVITEAERVKLLERHQRAMLANQNKSGTSTQPPPEA
jgi:hypothetical protein